MRDGEGVGGMRLSASTFVRDDNITGVDSSIL